MKFDSILEKVEKKKKLEDRLEVVFSFEPIQYSKLISEGLLEDIETTNKVSDILPGKLVTFDYVKPSIEEYDKHPLCIVLSRNSTFVNCINLNYLPIEVRKYFLSKYLQIFKSKIERNEELDRLDQGKIDIEVNSLIKSFSKIGIKIAIKNYKYSSIKKLIVFKYEEIPLMSLFINPKSKLSYKKVLKDWLIYMKENSNK